MVTGIVIDVDYQNMTCDVLFCGTDGEERVMTAHLSYKKTLGDSAALKLIKGKYVAV